MVSLKEIKSSNATLKSGLPGLVSVFVGGTGGIGASTLKQLAISTNAPKVYLVGRSLTAATPQLNELKTINPAGTFNFIEAQVSLLKEVDRVSAEISSKEQKVDLLFVSTGILSLEGRQDTSEGLGINLALTYYSRLRFTSLLLPLLSHSAHPRVVSVLAGGNEAAIVTDDLSLKTNYTFVGSANQGTTLNTLALEYLSTQNHNVGFVHAYPGFVDTGLIGKFLGSAKGWLGWLTATLNWTVHPILKLFAYSVEEAGERALYEATNARFEKGFFRVNQTQEEAGRVEILEKYRAEGWPKKVWEHTEEIFAEICGGQ